MTTFEEFLKELLRDPAFKKEYDALDEEFARISAQVKKEAAERLAKAKCSVCGKAAVDITVTETGDFIYLCEEHLTTNDKNEAV